MKITYTDINILPCCFQINVVIINLFIPYFSHVAENFQKPPFNILMRFFTYPLVYRNHLRVNIFARATTFLSTLAVCNIFGRRQLKNTAARKMLSRQAARYILKHNPLTRVPYKQIVQLLNLQYKHAE